MKYIQLLRIKHYIKNVLIFVPLFFGQQLLDSEKLLIALFGFISFSTISSAVYVINDINDIEKDRQHPTKKNRPLASGAVSKKSALVLAFICIIISIGVNFLVEMPQGIKYILAYLGINIAYSKGLKDYPLIDVTILTSGF